MTLILALIGHLVGDYLLQNDWMALNKKKATLPCAIHCALWSLSVWAFTWSGKVALGWKAWILVPLFVTHFAQDRTTLIEFWMTNINRQRKFAVPPMAPWSCIVVDNVWHILTIWAIWKFLV